jgi:hypothetical protein
MPLFSRVMLHGVDHGHGERICRGYFEASNDGSLVMSDRPFKWHSRFLDFLAQQPPRHVSRVFVQFQSAHILP